MGAQVVLIRSALLPRTRTIWLKPEQLQDYAEIVTLFLALLGRILSELGCNFLVLDRFMQQKCYFFVNLQQFWAYNERSLIICQC